MMLDEKAASGLYRKSPVRETYRKLLFCRRNYPVHATILTSQVPLARWHEQIGDPTLADGILDRLVHNPHRIEMKGDSMRKSRTKANP